MSSVEPLAIIGMACRLPGGVRSPDDLWNLLVDGVDAISEVPKERWHLSAMYHPDPSKPGRMYSRWGGFIDQFDQFDAQFFGISPREAARADPQQRLLLEAAYEAVEDAGLTLASLAGKRASVHVGISSYDFGSLQIDLSARGAIDAYTNLGLAASIAANRISYFFDLVGPSLIVDTACSSSLVATHLGCRSIWNGESELAFVAGVNLVLRPELTIGFSKASMLSPDGRCKSFDSRANGFVRSEGVAVVILKPLARALADRDRIHALIRATAVNQDGRTDGITVPNQASQEANIVDALRLADIAAESVQFVEAHGTGTPVGDPIEAAALGAVYGRAQKPENRCLIGSVKSNIGHVESASGIAGLIKAALCLRHRQIPANLHFEQPNPKIAFDDLRLRVPQRHEPWPQTNGHPPRAAVNSFGFGGTNAHAILEAPPEPARAVPTRIKSVGAEPADGRAWMLPLSARSVPALSDLARSYLNTLTQEPGLRHVPLRDICFSASVKRSHHEHRLALVAHDHAEMAEQLAAFLRDENRVNSSTGRASDQPMKPVFVCSGMGQQWWAMGRELLAQEPVFRQAVEEVSDLYGRLAGWSLLEKLTADESCSEIQRTHVGQPAILATQIGLAALWRSWGVEPAAVFGHSAGELAASYIAGVLSLDDVLQVAFHRSELQRRMAGQGTMLAAGISREEAARFVERHPQAISIAAVNGPRSVTLSGDASVLAEIDNALNEAGQFSRALRVEVPYHSPKMEQFRPELLESLRDIRPRLASTPFFSTVTGTTLSGLELDTHYWYRNIRQPVLFSDTMGELVRAGHRVFLEIGAHPILRRDIVACVAEQSVQGTALCSLRREDRERAAMLGSLGRMYTLGAEIDWHKVFPSDSAAVNLPSYPFQREVYWREPERVRRMRVGESIHPLLGNRVEGPQPSWQVELDTASLGYLVDHRIGDSIIFPGAGYVEMALAAARETFGPVPCILEDVDFQKFLVLNQNGACTAQVLLDADSSDFDVYVRPDASDNSWDLHAHGSVRKAEQTAPPRVDFAQIRARCPDPMEVDEFFRTFAEMGLNYGPTFRGISRIWRGNRELLAEIRVPDGLSDGLSEYRLHPAVFDACIQSVFAVLPAVPAKGEAYVPVKIERIRFYATPATRLFCYARLSQFDPAELKADLQILDEAGNHLVDVQGVVGRPTRHSVQHALNAYYEYQWKLDARPATRGERDSRHLPALELLAPVLQEEVEALWVRLGRARFQDHIRPLSRAAAVAYVVRALRELGWTPELGAGMPTEALADRLGVAPQYHGWLRLVLRELTADEMASTDEPTDLWRTVWNQFPEGHAEVRLYRLCGENLAAVLRGEIDPLNLLFPDGALATSEQINQDSPTFRVNNLIVQKTVGEIARRLPKGRALRILEIGGGTGGMTSFVLPVLPQYCTEYVFSDISPRFLTHAQRKFTGYPFVQYRTLDIERDPLEQGFDVHSFDVIIASDVLHATRNLRSTLDRVTQLLGSGGMLVLFEPTHPWLAAKLTFGLLKGWWLFDDHDVRGDEACVSAEKWKGLLREAGFSGTVCIADSPDADSAQYSVILARGRELLASPGLAPKADGETKTWLLFVDEGTADRPSSGTQLAAMLRDRGDRVIEVVHGTEFRQSDGSGFIVRAGEADDMRRLMGSVREGASRLAGVIHLWSLDTETAESMTSEAHRSSARLGCVGVMQLLQTLAATDGLGVESVWLVTRSTQPIENHADPLQVAQSPLWGLGRVAINEYPNLRCRLIDLATGSRDEIESLADELNTIDSAEDEIALHGELRYVRRLVPVSATSVHGIGRQTALESQPFRIELQRPGILDSLTACPIKRRPPGSNEVEVAVAAAGLNFKDLMLAMGLLPKAAITDDSVGRLLGLECSGRVIAVGDRVSEFAVGDDVVACGVHTMASHITVDRRFIAVKPRNLSFEQAAAFPIAFLTAWYSLHTLGQMRRGERVLIHLGTGGVGLAAVQLALRAGAIVFATAGSPEKRELLTALGVSHVMDSRTLTFADEVMQSTNGEGVDIVLNSLAGEAIDKGLSILRPYGRFIEIGKVDIYKNRKVGLRPLSKSISVFAVDLTDMLQCRPEIIKSIAGELVAQFECGSLHPLPHRVFSVARVADAFRHMAEAKHVGKLVISMQDAEGLQFERGLRAVAVDPGAGYLITGGLGGFGLAVADHLAQRGARHLALVGRSGPSPAGQAALDSLRRGGVEVMVCQADIADRVQVQRVIADIERSMGPLRGVVHAAMVLDDAPIERLTEERMWKAMAPKLMGAWNLHTLTANAPLDFFVMFSSFASIVGNPGQANYVAGNAFLDALAYYRRARRLPALTVNWGVLGEVGHVATNPETLERLDRLGIKAMPLSETLAALDELMSSNAVQVGVAQLEWKALLRSTFSRIPARFGDLAGEGGAEEGRATASTYLRVILEADAATLPSLLETYIRDDVARAMGASPARIDTQQSLLSLGLDSLIAVEVRNRINDDLGVNVSLAKFMQSASISALAAYVAEQLLKGDRGEHSKTEAPPIAAVTEADIPSGGVEARVPKPLDQSSDQALLPHPAVQGMVGGIGRRDSGVASAGRRPSPCLVPIQPKGTKTPLFCVHPIGGAVHGYLALARRLGPDQPIHGLQDTGLNGESGPLDSIEDMARRYVEAIGAMQQTGPYLLAGWSMGGQIAFEMAQQFTQLGENVALLTLFDAFPAQAEHEIDLGLWLDEVRATSNPADQRELGEVEQAMRRHLRASARHKPSSYPGRVLLFLATEQDLLSRSRNVRFWRGPVAGGLELETVPASHFTIMQEPSIGPVARRLAAALDRAVRQTGQDVASAPSDALQPGNA